QAAPAAAVERGPLAFRLCQTVGDRIDHGGMMTHAAMAAFDLDTLGGPGGLLHAALPGAEPVGAAEPRRGRHRRRTRQRSAETSVLLVGAAAARPFVEPPSGGGPGGGPGRGGGRG